MHQQNNHRSYAVFTQRQIFFNTYTDSIKYYAYYTNRFKKKAIYALLSRYNSDDAINAASNFNQT